jgi:hypothetical protein
MGEFLYLYLKKRFGNQEIICEWAYNLLDACSRYKDSSIDCLYFLMMLNEEVDQDSYAKVILEPIEKLKDKIVSADELCNENQAKGFLDKKSLVSVINQFFKMKFKKVPTTIEEVSCIINC